MKTRITLTVDPKISHRAKEAAQRQGISLSGLVEKLLSEAAGPAAQKSNLPFSQRWKGNLQLPPPADKRAERLQRKYKLTN